MSKRAFGSVPTLLWAVLTLSCPQDRFQNSDFRCLQCQQHEGKLEKEKGSHLSQEDLGTRSGETVSKAARSPAGRTSSICLAMFCNHSETNSERQRRCSPREFMAPQIPRQHLLMNVPIIPGAKNLSLNTANKPNQSTPEERSLLPSSQNNFAMR